MVRAKKKKRGSRWQPPPDKIDTFALSHPERALIPISSPSPPAPRSGSFFYNEPSPLGRRKAVARTNSSGLLRLGHMPFGGEWFFFGEYLICLNVAQAILSIFSIVIAEQPKEGCSDRDGEPRPWDSRGSLTGTKVGDTHGSIQDVQIELVGGCFFNSLTLAAGIAIGTYWQALFVNYLVGLIIIAVEDYEDIPQEVRDQLEFISRKATSTSTYRPALHRRTALVLE